MSKFNFTEESLDLLGLYGNSLPGFWGIKSRDHSYLLANNNWKSEVGLNPNFDVLGLIDSELPCIVSRCANKFKDQDEQVISTRKPIKVLNIHPFNNHDCRAYITSKFPFVRNNEVLGVVFSAEKVDEQYFCDLSTLLGIEKGSLYAGLKQYSFVLSPPNFAEILTDREQECLFFLIRGKTAKDIGSILDLSYRTVEHYIESLKYKFSCSTKAELVASAFSKGFFTFLPKKLLSENLINRT